MGLIPGQRTKIPHAIQYGQKRELKKKKNSSKKSQLMSLMCSLGQGT